MCSKSFLCFSVLHFFFTISPILLTSSTFLFVIAQTLAQKKCQRDHHTCVFQCRLVALAGDTRLYIFLIGVEWLFMFLASSKGLRAFSRLRMDSTPEVLSSLSIHFCHFTKPCAQLQAIMQFLQATSLLFLISCLFMWHYASSLSHYIKLSVLLAHY